MVVLKLMTNKRFKGLKNVKLLKSKTMQEKQNHHS